MSDEAVTTTEDDPDSLIARAKEWYKQARDHSSDWRTEAREDFAFYAGDQWSAEDKAVLQEQLRPIIAFNRVGPVVDAVSGTEVSNRQEVRYIPREMGDARPNEILTAAAEWVRDNTDAEDEESDAFVDMVTCGMGWVETRLDYDTNPDGDIAEQRTDPLEMYWDPGSRKKNLSDARYIMRVKDVPLEEAKELFPDAEEDDLHAAWAIDPGEEGDKPHDADEDEFYRNDQNPGDDKLKKQVRIVELQWWEKERAYKVLDPETGQSVEMDRGQHSKIKKRFEAFGMPLRSVEFKRKVYKRAFIGKVVLEEGPSPCPEGFTLCAMTGKRDRNNNTWYGLVRAMKDPQRWANKWLSQILHIINSNAKGGLMAETDAFDNIRKAEEQWAEPNSITWMKAGAISQGKVKEKPAAQLPAGLDKLLEFAISSIRDVTGVNLELLGLADREQAGVLEYQRKQAGITILAGMFDALRRYRKEQGRVMLYFIRRFISDGRLIRITGEQGDQRYIPLIRDAEGARYDVIVDDAPSAPNQKERVWQILVQMFPILSKTQLPVAVWLDLLRYSPLPESLTQSIAQKLQEASQQPNPMQQAELAKVRAETMGEEADARKTMAETAKIGAETASEQMSQFMAAMAPPEQQQGARQSS